MTWMSTFEKLHRDVYSVLQKHAAHTKCDLWVWDVFPTSRCRNWRRSGSVHCLQSCKQPFGHCLPICKTCKGLPCLQSSRLLRFRIALDFVRTWPCGKADYCWLSYEPENGVARELYRSFGFAETGEYDVEEMIAVLELGGTDG